MTFDQIAALVVLVGVVGLMIHGKMRADVVALLGAAVLLVLGVVRPVEVQAAFASPAVIALAGLFVIAYAIELSGLLGLMIRKATALCRRFGAVGIWAVIGLCGSVGGFLNNTPVVVLAAPVVRDMARSLKLSPKRFLMPLSHVTVLGGLLTLIGTSTNLLVNDMARNAGQPVFSLFEITPVGLVIALVGSGGIVVAVANGAQLPWPATLLFAAATALGMGAGRKIAPHLSEKTVQRGFALVLLCAAASLVVKAAISA